MNTIKYINPEGEVVDIPVDDAAHFDAKGWVRADAKEENDSENADTNDEPGTKRGRKNK